jgi:hypothetical protein
MKELNSMAKTKLGVFEGEVYWAKVFEGNMDDSEYHKATQGQFNCVFIPKDDEELEKMKKMGFPEKSMGNAMIREYDVADGRKGMKLKRPNKHAKIEEFGGAPIVTRGISDELWDMDVDGELGNGTKVKVKISIYGEGSTASVRLEKIAVLELVKFEANATMGW